MHWKFPVGSVIQLNNNTGSTYEVITHAIAWDSSPVAYYYVLKYLTYTDTDKLTEKFHTENAYTIVHRCTSCNAKCNCQVCCDCGEQRRRA